MCNEYLTFKWNRVATGELSERTFHDYYRACDRLIDCLGPSRRVEYLTPVDFERLCPPQILYQSTRVVSWTRWGNNWNHLAFPWTPWGGSDDQTPANNREAIASVSVSRQPAASKLTSTWYSCFE